jgi:riboflavin biosynthesis pyrimidine reductase
MVEGGAGLLQSFIDAGMWDEIRRIENQSFKSPGNRQDRGLSSPVFTEAMKKDELNISDDKIEIFYSLHNSP